MMTLTNAAIISVALCFLGFANWQMAQSPVETAPILTQARPQEFPAANAPDEELKQPAISLRQASARPLFAPSRRPWTPPLQPAAAPMAEIQAEAPVAPLAPPPAVTLIGIQKSPTGSTALLVTEAGTTPIWLKEGEVYQSWQVRNINAASVDLANGDSKLTLELYPDIQTGTSMP